MMYVIINTVILFKTIIESMFALAIKKLRKASALEKVRNACKAWQVILTLLNLSFIFLA